MVFLNYFDADEVKRIHESGSAKSVKRKWIKEGYTWQLSLYGVLTDREQGESGYVRTEILSNEPYDEATLSMIYQFFHDLKLPTPYSIWIYDKGRDAVRRVGVYK